MKLRDFFGSISGIPPPPPPDLLPKMSYEPITPVLYLSLWDALKYMGEPIKSEKPINMENLPVNGEMDSPLGTFSTRPASPHLASSAAACVIGGRCL